MKNIPLRENVMDQEEKHHVLSYAQLGAVLAVLLVLTGITVGVSYVHLGPGGARHRLYQGDLCVAVFHASEI